MGIENTKIGKLLNHILEHILTYWNLINTICFVLVGILFSLNKDIFWGKIHSNSLGWWVLILTIISSGFYIIKQSNYSSSIERIEKDKKVLEEKIQGLENKLAKINSNSIEIVEIHLAYLFQKLGLSNNERITLYKFINDEFFVLGRYSTNHEKRKRSRKSYKKEGLIFRAWNESKYFKNNGIPASSTRRGKFKSGYYKIINAEAPIDEETVWNMKMKSRSFYIKTLKDLNGLEQTSIIVIESTLEKAFEESTIDSIFDIDEEKRLVAFVEKIDWDFPNISNAKEKGF